MGFGGLRWFARGREGFGGLEGAVVVVFDEGTSSFGIGSAARRDVALWRKPLGVSEAAGGGRFTLMDAPEGKEEKSRKKESRRKKDKACLRRWGEHFFELKLASRGVLIAKHSEVLRCVEFVAEEAAVSLARHGTGSRWNDDWQLCARATCIKGDISVILVILFWSQHQLSKPLVFFSREVVFFSF